jgi:hypothetical protein
MSEITVFDRPYQLKLIWLLYDINYGSISGKGGDTTKAGQMALSLF